MRLHLVSYSTNINTHDPFQKLSGRLYWKKRLQFWKWKLYRTMGRPVLVLRKGDSTNGK